MALLSLRPLSKYVLPIVYWYLSEQYDILNEFSMAIPYSVSKVLNGVTKRKTGG